MKEIRRCLTDFNFPELFIQNLLWDSFRAKHAFEVNGQFFEVEGVAQKRGLVAFVCKPAPNQLFPGSAERKRIGREIEKLRHEHLIVFIDREQAHQVWAVPKREDGKTKGTSEIPYFSGKSVEHLARRIQKISFSLEESETTTIVEVAARVNQALLAERVTKKFFKEFSDHRKAFVKFLDWIEDESKRDWYCSVLLNRLMFIYFLGGKGFLPGGTAFLTNNLAKNTAANGANTFYTHFLLPLSFFGLGEKKGKRGRFEETFEDVLYLDGGLFTVHQVERELGLNKEAVEKGVFPDKTKIPDIEFKRWFDYFDKWRWTLDEDKVENDGYISPHILGYIFEKYINQKQMGAYYTKEDITGYICRNTIIPRLFDMLAETGEKGKRAVRPLPVGPHPNLLNDGRGISDGEGIDRYIYASVKQEAKLPTETDYEQEQRRKRYEGILEDFDTDKIQGIDDFITYNLDIEKLALDFVSNIQDPEVLHAFYFKGLQQITVLDPTCGSGAFLFEALIILYPLYNACLSRMRYLVGKATGNEPDVVNWGGRLHFDDLDVNGSTLVDLVQGAGSGSKVLNDLRAEVERINDHPSAEYFIKKSIIVNNLFGVDIMEEAVEICKLRLFLTLIATVERDDSKENFGVEPLPDIDFNILAGNTLVGYTSIADIDRLWHEVELGSSTLAFEKDHSRLKKLVEEYGKVLRAWRLQQLGEWSGAPLTKEQVLKAVESVRPDLNEDVWRLYRTAGLATKQVRAANGKTKSVDLTQAEFVKTHEPFHWLLEFPSIEAAGGFDVIVGNPPYKVFSSSEVGYDLISGAFQSFDCKNLYAFVAERSLKLGVPQGSVSMIVPLTITSSERVTSIQDLLLSHGLLAMVSFPRRPESVFDGVEMPVTIFICGSNDSGEWHASPVRRFYTVERPSAIETTSLTPSIDRMHGHRMPKLASNVHRTIMQNLLQHDLKVSGLLTSGAEGVQVYYQEACRYWMKAQVGLPFFRRNGVASEPAHGRVLRARSEAAAAFCACLFNSSLFYLFYSTYSDCEHVNDALLKDFPVPANWDAIDWVTHWKSLSQSLTQNASKKTILTKQGHRIEYDEQNAGKSKETIDSIEIALGEVFALTDDQLNFVVNYDLKYRLGQSAEENDN